MTKTLLNKTYCADSIVDIESDVFEAIESSDVPKDEHGFYKGEFRVTVEWVEDAE